MCEKVPVQDKILWTISEAAEMSGIGTRTLYKMIKENPDANYIFHKGQRNVLIKKDQFCQFLAKASSTEDA